MIMTLLIVKIYPVIPQSLPIRLKSIAETVFSHFSPSLKVQVVHRNEERFENYFKYYGKNYLTHKLTFRDPFDGIIEYLEELRCP